MPLLNKVCPGDRRQSRHRRGAKLEDLVTSITVEHFHPFDQSAQTPAFLRSCMNLNPDNR